MNQTQLKNIIEAAIMTADTPASIDYLLRLFTEEEQVGRDEIKTVLAELQTECETRSIELKEVASGFRYQAKQEVASWLSRLEVERPARYSRALLETLSLIVYRQPVTRAEIEDVRGVAVSSSIIKTLLEREWVRVVGHRDVPGKPALYGTTRQFLDYFNLKSLSELPPLAEIRSLDSIQNELELKVIIGGEGAANGEVIDAPDEAASASPTAESNTAKDGDDDASVTTASTVDTSIADTSREGVEGHESATETQTDAEDNIAADTDSSDIETDISSTLVNDEQTDEEDPLAARAG